METYTEYAKRAMGYPEDRAEWLPRTVPRELRTERMVLTPLDVVDAIKMHPHITDAVTRLWLDWDTPRNSTDTATLVMDQVKARSMGDFQGWVARHNFEHEDGTDMVGVVQFVRRDEAVDGAWYELDFWVIEGHWGKGYALEMAKAALEWLRERAGITKLNLSWTDGNIASARVIERIVGPQEPIVLMAENNGEVVPVYNYTLKL
jgi:RimJ/RimL family protein N-acetyltransferase